MTDSAPDQKDDHAYSLNIPGSGNVVSQSADEEVELDEALAAASSEVVKVDAGDDEEFRLAKAMAMAIKTNPNLTTEEIQKLVSAQHSPKFGTGASYESDNSNILIPGRLTDMLKGKESTNTVTTSGSNDDDRHSNDKDKKHSMKSNLKMFQKTIKNSHFKGKLLDITSKSLGSTLHFNTKKAVKSGPSEPAVPGMEEKSCLDNIPAHALSSGTLESAGQFSSVNEEYGSIPLIQEDKDKKVKLMDVVWKRRSGFGKYSTSSAWERRRMILRGNKIYYYRADGEQETNHDHAAIISPSISKEHDPDSSHAKASSYMFDGTTLKKGLMDMGALLGATSVTDADPNAPRGYLDLIKEEAIVAAASGHSGAPSPFAISIKVKNETKWKLCFATHKIQMDWLVALTDVVVQASVDSYNTYLLDCANPSTDTTLSYHQQVNEPPRIAANETSQVHRLWMMEKYAIHVVEKDADSDDDDNEDDEKSLVSSATIAEFPMDNSRSGHSDEDKETIISTSTSADNDLKFYSIGMIWNLSVVLTRVLYTSSYKFMLFVTLCNVSLFMHCDAVAAKETIERVIGKNSLLDFFMKDIELEAKVSKSITVESNDPKAKGKSRNNLVAEKIKLSKKVVPATPIPEGFKPTAGTTAKKIENTTEVPENKDGDIFTGWRAISGESFQVRSHGYLTTKKKVPSPGELYTCANVDFFESASRYANIAQRVHLPKVTFKNDSSPKTWVSPDIFVVSIALPTDPPKLGRPTSDGGGYTITSYFTMNQETRDILRRVTAEGYDPSTEEIDDRQKSKVNAVRLFEEWCKRSPTEDKMQTRFKLVPNAPNLTEIGMPSWIAKYNGKPVLIKRPGQTGFLYTHPELSCIEYDISLHVFPYVAKQAICYLKEAFFKKIIIGIGFVIEGREDDELPECTIGVMQLCYPNPIHATKAGDFFAGISAKSFDDSKKHHDQTEKEEERQ